MTSLDEYQGKMQEFLLVSVDTEKHPTLARVVAYYYWRFGVTSQVREIARDKFEGLKRLVAFANRHGTFIHIVPWATKYEWLYHPKGGDTYSVELVPNKLIKSVTGRLGLEMDMTCPELNIRDSVVYFRDYGYLDYDGHRYYLSLK